MRHCPGFLPSLKSQRRKNLPIEEKESIKWLNSFTRVAEIQALCPQTLLVSMGDRESDIFDLFALAARHPAGPKLLVRAERIRERRVEDQALWDFMNRKPLAGELILQLPRRGQRSARQAKLAVRFSAVTLQAPKRSALPAVDAWAVLLLEEAAADGGEPIEWMLLTTVAVTTFADVLARLAGTRHGYPDVHPLHRRRPSDELALIPQRVSAALPVALRINGALICTRVTSSGE